VNSRKSNFKKVGTQQPLPITFLEISDVSILASETTKSKGGKTFKKCIIAKLLNNLSMHKKTSIVSCSAVL